MANKYLLTSAENLKRLFTNAGKLDKEIIALTDKTLQGCDTCRMYRKANPKPIVGFSWATVFNQTVGMGLHQKKVFGIYILLTSLQGSVMQL